MNTNAEIYADLLGYFGVEDISHATADQPEQVRKAVNAAIQKLYARGPDWLRVSRGSGALMAPVALSGLTFTHGSKVVAGAGITPEMVGQTVIIGGERGTNEFVSQTQLSNPILGGSTAGGTAMLYFDAVPMDPQTVMAVGGQVVMDGSIPLIESYHQEGGESRMRFDYQWLRGNPAVTVGVPEIYWVETMPVQSGGYFANRLRVYPAPREAHLIEWRGSAFPATVSLADLQNAAKFIPVPGGMHESIFLPIARAELAKFPNFQLSKVDLVKGEAVQAFADLKDLTPQKQGGAKLRPFYGLPFRR